MSLAPVSDVLFERRAIREYVHDVSGLHGMAFDGQLERGLRAFQPTVI